MPDALRDAQRGNCPHIVVKKVLTDAETKALLGTKLPRGQFKTVIKNQDIDVFTEDGRLLLRFRRNVLPKEHIDAAYDAIIQHARKQTSTRGITSGNKGHAITGYNDKIQSNIIGQFDTISVRLKYIFNQAGEPFPKCRPAAFNMYHPEKFAQFVPLVRDIDHQYKSLFPKEHAIQLRAAKRTRYHHIKGTAFSTVTTNLNLQTATHQDKGDWTEGFGNLVVIQRGKQDGGQTGFPQQGVAVDVREGDFLAMDVHQLHGNEPMQNMSKDAERLSLVCQLREGLVEKCPREPAITKDYLESIKARAAKQRGTLKKGRGATRRKTHRRRASKI